MKKETAKKIQKYMKAFEKDVGGWGLFTWRLIFNSAILYYLLKFLKGFFLYSFKAQEIIPPDKYVEMVGVLLWAVGIMFMLIRLMRVDEEG